MTDKIAVVELLLANENIDINLADQWQFTPLMFACISKPINMDIITLLLEKGCDVNVQDKAYNTALIHSCKQNHFPAIKALLRNGANIHLSNIDNETPEKVLASEEDRKAFRAEVSISQPDVLHEFKDPNKKPHWINNLNATNKTAKK
jgi:ankyrin repeat protein